MLSTTVPRDVEPRVTVPSPSVPVTVCAAAGMQPQSTKNRIAKRYLLVIDLVRFLNGSCEEHLRAYRKTHQRIGRLPRIVAGKLSHHRLLIYRLRETTIRWLAR